MSDTAQKLEAVNQEYEAIIKKETEITESVAKHQDELDNRRKSLSELERKLASAVVELDQLKAKVATEQDAAAKAALNQEVSEKLIETRNLKLQLQMNHEEMAMKRRMTEELQAMKHAFANQRADVEMYMQSLVNKS